MRTAKSEDGWDSVLEDTGSDRASAPVRMTRWDLRKIRTKRDILRAGRKVFAEQGITSPKVDDVASEAGISRAAFYLHFKSLDELMVAIFQREVRWQLRRYRSLDWNVLESVESIRDWLLRFFASFREERHFVLIVYRAYALDPMNLRLLHAERESMVLHLARRIPQLRILNDDGDVNLRRFTAMKQISSRLEDISLYSAYNSWTTALDTAIDLVSEELHEFAHGKGRY